MKWIIKHECKGRIRVQAQCGRMSIAEADMVEAYFNNTDGICQIKVYERTADVVICYKTKRAFVISQLLSFSYDDTALAKSVPNQSGRLLKRQYEEKLIGAFVMRFVAKTFFPAPLRLVALAFRSFRYIRQGLASLRRGKIEVAVLDATAIGVSMLRRDYKTAASIMFLLKIGDILEEWTHKKSVSDLARTMSLGVERVWLCQGDAERLVAIEEVQVGDHIVVRAGSLIPVDGKVISGEATVNQASITGESASIAKMSGAYVYAGTVIEEGYLVIEVDKASGSGQYDRILSMIEASECLKSHSENKASSLADRLVPYSLGGTLLTWLLTRNLTKALAILMVDFSCALKLAMPLAVLSAMRESGYYHISVKGGRFLEAVSKADTLVFDKTGTLTNARPTVAQIIPFGGHDGAEMLRLAACLEEHYPHSIANAVVEEAKRRHLPHDEMHSEIEYVVAHGISSQVDGKKVVIGSKHFVLQDEGCTVPINEQTKFDTLPEEHSHLFLAISGELAAVICIADPLRPEAASVISTLRSLGVKNIVMMTGDNNKTAEAVARSVGIDTFFAEVLPEDKAAFIQAEREAGRVVMMVGDGVNDSPALSEADAGIALSDGAALAREIADITISATDLNALVTLKTISNNLMKRINQNYYQIISFNSGLIVLGVTGVVSPTTSALLHNMSTLAIGLRSMTNLLD